MKFAKRNNIGLIKKEVARSKAEYHTVRVWTALESNVKYNIFKTHQKFIYAYFI